MDVHNKKSLLEYRRRLRKQSTQAEITLWQHIRSGRLNGLKFKRQHSIGNYIVDFYCASKRLIVELDGGVHLNPEQIEKDKFRDQNLTEMDFTVLRFTNDEILFNIDYVKERIAEHCRSLTQHPLLFFQGEGLRERLCRPITAIILPVVLFSLRWEKNVALSLTVQ